MCVYEKSKENKDQCMFLFDIVFPHVCCSPLSCVCTDVHYDDDNFKIPSLDCLLVYLLILRLRTIKTNKENGSDSHKLHHAFTQGTFCPKHEIILCVCVFISKNPPITLAFVSYLFIFMYGLRPVALTLL